MEEQEIPNVKVVEEGGNYPSSSGLPPTAIGEATSNLLLHILDSITLLDNIEHYLKGEVLAIDQKTKKPFFKEIDGRRMMNDNGVNKILFVLDPLLGKEFVLGDIDNKEIHTLTESLMHEIIDMCYLNFWEWEINSTQFCTVIQWLDTVIFLSLVRIRGGGMAKIVKPVLKRVETIMPEQKKKGGLFGGFFK